MSDPRLKIVHRYQKVVGQLTQDFAPVMRRVVNSVSGDYLRHIRDQPDDHPLTSIEISKIGRLWEQKSEKLIPHLLRTYGAAYEVAYGKPVSKERRDVLAKRLAVLIAGVSDTLTKEVTEKNRQGGRAAVIAALVESRAQ